MNPPKEYLLVIVFTCFWQGCSTGDKRGVFVDDLNLDGRPDCWVHYEGERTTKIEYDRNSDGKIDQTIWYADGLPARLESDENFDGQTDVWGKYQYGFILIEELDTDFNGVPDATADYEFGVLQRMTWRPNRGTHSTIVEIFSHGVKVEERVDADGDGRFESVRMFDAFGNEMKSLSRKEVTH